jgi:hypothetical protein
MPSRSRKEAMPDSTEMPAPVRMTREEGGAMPTLLEMIG